MALDSQKVDTANLSAAFPRQFPTAESIADIVKLAGDISTRCYYRVGVKNRTQTWILQTSETFAPERMNEHLFLSMLNLLKQWGVRVPASPAASPERGWILLEDLGDGTLQHSGSVAHYRAAIDELVRWTVKSCAPVARVPHFAQAFDFEKLQAEMKFTAVHLLEGLLSTPAAEFLAAVEPNSKYLDECPRFLAHRDYHSRNIMLKDDSVYVIDFQDARMGPITYDIVSLLWDPYVRLGESMRQELLEYWRTSTLRAGEGVAPIAAALSDAGAMPRWKIELERMKIQRLLKATGSYAMFYRTRGRPDYLLSIAPALAETQGALRKLSREKAATVADDKLLSILESLNLKAIDILS